MSNFKSVWHAMYPECEVAADTICRFSDKIIELTEKLEKAEKELKEIKERDNE